MIHDSFGTTAKHAATLSRCLREEYIKFFEENDVVEDFRQQMLKCIPEVAPAPRRGTLDLKGVLESKYFFS
jgi:DNA-directed RNA polymerase